jgi:MFS family permease
MPEEQANELVKLPGGSKSGGILDSADVSHQTQNQDDTKTYPNYPIWRKCIIVFVVAWMTFVISFSTTSLIPAAPEIAIEYNSTPETLFITNAGVFVAMAMSSFIWNPIIHTAGRRPTYWAASLLLCASSIGTALAPNMATFIAFRILTGLMSLCFLISGQTIIVDIFEPVSS